MRIFSAFGIAGPVLWPLPERAVGLSALFALLLTACAGPSGKAVVTRPAEIPEAAQLRTIAVLPFQGQHSNVNNAIRSQVESMLASIKVGPDPYFSVLSRGRLGAEVQRLGGQREVDLGTAVSIGRNLGVEGIYTGHVNLVRVDDEHFTVTNRECTERAQPKNFLEQMTMITECLEVQDRDLSCTRRTAAVVVVPQLIDTASGRVVYAQTLTGEATDEVCEGAGRSLSDEWTLIQASVGTVLKELEAHVAPHEEEVHFTLMADAGDLPESAAARFGQAIGFMQAGRADRACPILRTLEGEGHRTPALYHNLAICAELANDLRLAESYCRRADALLTEPSAMINQCLDRLSTQLKALGEA